MQNPEELPGIGTSKGSSKKHLSFFIAAVIAISTLATYSSVKDNDFINYDDTGAIFDNSQVQRGLSWETIRWAFTTTEMAYWHPLTWLSHMLDCELFGLWPAMHHLHNLLLHLLNALLLFWILNRTTRRLWPSAFVALVFALHPIQVESVAWATERKDVLSGLFWMLTLAAYVWYTVRPCASRYLLVCGLLALGLMAKPVLIMLPWALLLFDVWPLRRITTGGSTNLNAASLRRLGVLFGEKVPLFILAFLPGALIYATAPIFEPTPEDASIFLHLINIPTQYLNYLGKLFWPQSLAVLEAFHPITSFWLGLLATLPLLLISACCVWQLRRRPYLLVGWLWYLGTIIPGLTLVWIGNNAWTYRISYLPAIGIYLAIAYGVGDLCAGRKRRVAGSLLAIALLLAMALATTRQIGYWRNNDTFFQYNLAIDPEHVTSHNNYGAVLYRRGLLDEAIWHFKMATTINPQFTWPKLDLIKAYMRQGSVEIHFAEIKRLLRDTLLWEPDNATAYQLLGMLYTSVGSLDQALASYREALYLQPDLSDAWYGWGSILAYQGAPFEAIEKWRIAVWLNPEYTMAHFSLGLTLLEMGQDAEAIDHIQTLLRLQPDWPEAYLELRHACYQQGHPGLGDQIYQEALRLTKLQAAADQNARQTEASP